jgi:excisionase family DNA binding protein
MKQLLTTKAAAGQLAMSPEFIKRLSREGRIKVVRLGRAVRIPQEEVERLSRSGVKR